MTDTIAAGRAPVLYDLEPSGNCYKVRLFASLAQIPLERRPVDFLAGDHKREPVIGLNPWGELPVLVDGDVVLRDSQAILVYLARRYGGEAWWPGDACRQGEVVQWLSTAANEIQHGPCTARLIRKFGMALDEAAARRTGDRILGLLEAHLVRSDWLAANRPTIADCAVFPYVALAGEGGIDLAPYPFIRAWIARIAQLPHFLPTAGLAPAA
ncbi:glutathione S-transferase family protein [Zavarzinia compransoris]|uniref:Glutathione S-transferase n=1 Tax=Zavarzinia compransoris TaxID=1264899 RepID=A0A317EC10_9PROT|nr:glutathione S-transferase [Zavarzinia compransoris]PWR23806.1 glutathione S-transferase [Zavarzinia compransoris]TDP48038.1 glutathione S-transferase [Zavarzinia compransoris]